MRCLLSSGRWRFLLLTCLAFSLCLASVRADGQDESNKDDSRKNFDGKRLVKATFENSNLTSATFRRAILTGANFRHSQITSTTFTDAKMSKADFRGATFYYAHFQNVDLTESNFEETDLSKQSFANCKLGKANFLNVTGILELDHCDVSGADFRGANLVGMSMIGLNQSNFRNAIYDSRTVWPEAFDPKDRGAKLVEDGPEPGSSDDEGKEESEEKPAPEKVQPEKSPRTTPPPKKPADPPKPKTAKKNDSGIVDSLADFDDRDAAALHQAGRYAQAEALYRKLAEAQPNNPEIIGGLLAAVAAQGKQDDVRKLTEQLIQIKQNSNVVDPDSIAPVDPAPANPDAVMPDGMPDANAPVADGGDDHAEVQEPVVASFVGGKPQGLYFMTRYWSYTSTLEKSAWYFAPNGEVYENPQTGFSPTDLAAHKGKRGRVNLVGKDLEVTWSDGTKSKSAIERDGGPGFAWDAGIFSPVQPLSTVKKLAGVYEGGSTYSTDRDVKVEAKQLDLNADGTFLRSGIKTVAGVNGYVDKSTGGGVYGEIGKIASGTWRASDYSITFNGDDQRSDRAIAFAFDDEQASVHPAHIYIGGVLYKKLK